MIATEIKGVQLIFETNDKVFSPGAVDRGTLAMLSQAAFDEGDKVLDLGCGYGVVGILASKLIGCEKVVMCDISEEAVRLSEVNAKINDAGVPRIVCSDGLNEIEERDFTLILSNPPYHTDFSVPKSFIEKGFRHLRTGGKMLMVTKRREWYKNKFISVFGGVRIVESDGYYVFVAEKREQKSGKIPVSKKASESEKKPSGTENRLSRKLSRKQGKQKKARDISRLEFHGEKPGRIEKEREND